MDFPDSPVDKTPCFQCRGAQVRSLVEELRSHRPCEQNKEKKLTASNVYITKPSIPLAKGTICEEIIYS